MHHDLPKVREYGKENHNNTLQTNPRNREEGPNNINSNKTSVRQLKQSNQRSFSVNMITQLERTQSNVYQSKDQTQIPKNNRR